MSERISLKSLVAQGYYVWDNTVPPDQHGRHFLRRTPKGDRAAANWSPEKLTAVQNLLAAASTIAA